MKNQIENKIASAFLYAAKATTPSLKDFLEAGEEVRLTQGRQHSQWHKATITQVNKRSIRVTLGSSRSVYHFSVDSCGYLYETGKRTNTWSARLSFNLEEIDQLQAREDAARDARAEARTLKYSIEQKLSSSFSRSSSKEDIEKLTKALEILNS